MNIEWKITFRTSSSDWNIYFGYVDSSGPDYYDTGPPVLERTSSDNVSWNASMIGRNHS